VLDDFLGNATDLPITEHATDTHGATLINFALFDLVGKALTPRMRDLTRVTLVRDVTPTEIARATRMPGRCWEPAGTRPSSASAGRTCCGWQDR